MPFDPIPAFRANATREEILADADNLCHLADEYEADADRLRANAAAMRAMLAPYPVDIAPTLDRKPRRWWRFGL